MNNTNLCVSNSNNVGFNKRRREYIKLVTYCKIVKFVKVT